MAEFFSKIKKWFKTHVTGRRVRIGIGVYFVIGGAVFCHMAVKENFLGFNLYATGVVMTSILWFFSSNGKGWEADKKHGKRK